MENLDATDILLLFVAMTVVVVVILGGGVLMASRAGRTKHGDDHEHGLQP